ncbi:hypothetical protein [Aliihoeflea sp. 2WW]|uniref:hypothetical protein n=1 Tax=Aliihoeflea sp. 2WW TaxID=1381123 RepID=UPI0012682FD8|nr:hypothetical protein [Aliihoeflea sp. 2WW]
MTNKKEHQPALIADENSIINADGSDLRGHKTLAKATNSSRISLKDAKAHANYKDNKNSYWYQRPMGLILISVISALIVAAITAIASFWI